MGHYTLVVMSNPVEGRDAEYNDWYSRQHLHDVLRVPGFASAERFKMVGAPLSEAGWQYCALYQLEHDRPQQAVDELLRRAGTDAMPMSDAMDPAWCAVLYESIGGISRADISEAPAPR